MSNVLLEAKGLKMHFPIKAGVIRRTVGYVKAVDGITLNVYKGESLGIVGESGSGKSTLGRMLLRLLDPTEGEVYFNGEQISNLSNRKMRPYRRDMQMVFQDPYASLNPRMTIGELLEEPLLVHKTMNTKADRKKRAEELLETVGLPKSSYNKYPHEFSGGQRQRVGIARALSTKPKLIIGDEPVSALDVSIQSQVLNLMKDLQDEFQLTYLFIAHDLSVVKHISDRVAVMYLGRIVEIAQKDSLYETPLHPYTEALISAVPSTDVTVKKEKISLKGELPSPANPPKGCAFHTRCPHAYERCKHERPEMTEQKDGHFVACHLYTDSSPSPV
ncbi:dipeptide ABC transporter ATP-binding protein [Shouchella clausii]|uniref:Oligopeptide ABC transporter ATP-binding protein n=2 Tax=Shouchella TaxID=2893057 RepID=Q5WFB0_SHOC1|nr:MULTISPECIES: dipeptide ABC transporter ATP-binding protein [Shouchella]MCM3312344.1 dipeptide ABC transporter ATP-binding protein [Psychrobacillus sp. MER TA 17]ALA54683.1 Oligopeptide transport ATP-binding protein OppF [Shouchella clausii]KKI84546.1 peptide ABC transporter substrate-binding protein [Shouchella clausii]MBU3230670.1 dipeptide ABC transporter ATP-binding protein [Shouchella clausii]MBU3263255.1 dipeptide ABC transporter ATP-binding protein [Shouchella clausii]